jgi:tRNA(His) 5'-end guanylyltransferase
MEDIRRPDELFLDWDKQKFAQFDSRIMIIPESEEVVNYFIWRQQDATRNSISMAAQSMFSHKELQGKSTSNMQDMMMLQKGVNWNDYPTRFKRGTSVIKVTDLYKRIKGSKTAGEIVPSEQAIDAKQAVGILGDQSKYELYERSSWKAVETPIFTQEREFILNTFNNGRS